MNANPIQTQGNSPQAAPTGGNQPNLTKVFNVDPPVDRTTWSNDYDEEWATFLAEKSRAKTTPGLNSINPEACPRVWNLPHR